MNIGKSTIEDIIERIVRVADPDAIILFGSGASGSMTSDSDIDLLVLKQRPENPRQERIKIRKALRGMGYPFDIIVMSTGRFEETKNVIGGIAYPARKYGKVIYEAA